MAYRAHGIITGSAHNLLQQHSHYHSTIIFWDILSFNIFHIGLWVSVWIECIWVLWYDSAVAKLVASAAPAVVRLNCVSIALIWFLSNFLSFFISLRVGGCDDFRVIRSNLYEYELSHQIISRKWIVAVVLDGELCAWFYLLFIIRCVFAPRMKRSFSASCSNNSDIPMKFYHESRPFHSSAFPSFLQSH